MKRALVLLLVVGCKYPDPGSDLPVDDGGVDDELELPRCPPFTRAENKFDLPGIAVAGISVAEDESFAVSFLYQDKVGYTVPPLGEEYFPSDLVNNVTSLHIVPDGSGVYITDFNTTPYARRAIATTTPTNWLVAVASGLPDDAFAGRPTDDDQRMAFSDTSRAVVQEWERVGGAWMFHRTYTPVELGLASDTQIFAATLTPDGETLLYSAGGGQNPYGVSWRARGAGGSFAGADGAYGGFLVEGTYDYPHATARCSHLWLHEMSTGKIERYDLLP